ncbi:hypothetical protein MASR2M17_09170 [Aminivibrio sp.]
MDLPPRDDRRADRPGSPQAGHPGQGTPCVGRPPAEWLKYVILAVILYFTWTLGTLAWRPWDPWVSWMHLSAGWDEIVSSPWGYVVLFLLVIGAGVFIERFWCRYLCPLGAAPRNSAEIQPDGSHPQRRDLHHLRQVQ